MHRSSRCTRRWVRSDVISAKNMSPAVDSDDQRTAPGLRQRQCQAALLALRACNGACESHPSDPKALRAPGTGIAWWAHLAYCTVDGADLPFPVEGRRHCLVRVAERAAEKLLQLWALFLWRRLAALPLAHGTLLGYTLSGSYAVSQLTKESGTGVPAFPRPMGQQSDTISKREFRLLSPAFRQRKAKDCCGGRGGREKSPGLSVFKSTLRVVLNIVPQIADEGRLPGNFLRREPPARSARVARRASSCGYVVFKSYTVLKRTAPRFRSSSNSILRCPFKMSGHVAVRLTGKSLPALATRRRNPGCPGCVVLHFAFD